MLLTEILFLLILTQTIITIIIAIIFPKLTVTSLIGITTFTLPALTCVGGAGLMVYFLSLLHSSNNGGDGPAFFGMIAITLGLPLLLIVPGVISALIALFILKVIESFSVR
jgi:hypothetical protein